MNKDRVTELLKDFRSYEYAERMCGLSSNHGDLVPNTANLSTNRLIRHSSLDGLRYARIVSMVKGAVSEVLSDDQQMVIRKKYLDRNTLTLHEIATKMHKDPSTISRLHTESIRKLSIALEPLSEDEMEITNFDHMFDPTWIFREPA